VQLVLPLIAIISLGLRTFQCHVLLEENWGLGGKGRQGGGQRRRKILEGIKRLLVQPRDAQ
jgi:hypothetical protein